MCELLGMSANAPTDICFSFSGLMQRGGQTGPHRDGWGMSFYDGKGCRSFHDPSPSAHSEIARLLREYPIKSRIVISHIRRANRGAISLENTHPFTRELWGRHWVFAHNGQLKGIKKLKPSFYQPVGTTDSEHAFCWLLSAIRARFATPPKNTATLTRFIAAQVAIIAELGVFNILLSDATHLYAHCSTHLSWITRRAPFGQAHLSDEDLSIDFKQHTSESDVVTLIATQPLTHNEVWQTMQANQFMTFKNGLPI